jgi:protein SCO1/2
MSRKYFIAIFILVLCLHAHSLFAGNVIIYGEPVDIQEISFLDQDSKPFTHSELANQWSLVFFGYTSCPDICPTTLGVLQAVLANLRNKAGNVKTGVKVIFVSLDPVRDTPKVLKDYISYFGEGFIAVTGKNNQEMERFTKSIGIEYDFEDMKTHQPIVDASELSPKREYLVNHFAGVFIIDPKARMSAVVFPPHDEHRLERLLSFIQKSENE